MLELIWHLLTKISTLTGPEKDAARSVLGDDAIAYKAVRVAQGRVLKLVFKLNKGRAFATFHTINLPSSGTGSRERLDITVHELTHVYQFQRVGSIYIWEALHAQRTEGYDYGGWHQLQQDHEIGKRYRDFNREQQAQIAQDYYRWVLVPELPSDDPMRQAYEPYIGELRRGEL